MPFADQTTIPLPALFVAATDPAVAFPDGRVQARRLWLDTSTGATGTLKKRNEANDGWDTLINLDTPVPNFTEVVQDIVGAMFPDTATIDWTYDDATGVVNGVVIGAAPAGSAGGDLSGTYPNPTLAGGASALSPAPSTLTDGATITWATGGARVNNAVVTLGGDRTLDLTGLVSGAQGTIVIIQDATGGRTLDLSATSFTHVIQGTIDTDTLPLIGAASSVEVWGFVVVGTVVYWAGGIFGSTSTATSAAATINAQTGTTYTLQASDNGKVVTLNNGSAITLTVPSGLGAGFNCLVIQKGAGQITFTTSSTTINNRQSHTKTAGEHAVCSLVADVANNFYLGGDTAA